MNPEQFRAWLESQAPALGAWGNFVTRTVSEKVEEAIGKKRFTTFFKISPSSRVKKIDSAIPKLEKKRYEDPCSQMTDLVGARFVVLLKSDILTVEKAIAAYTGWTLSQERDPTFEISQDPNVFDYQSSHYLVRSVEDRVIDGVDVPAETTCEIQIRTLLQHAYAELVHDNVYKPEGVVPIEAKRLIARCMALMETTDEMFCSALEELKQVNTDRETWLQFLTDEFGKLPIQNRGNADEPITHEFLDTYRELLQLANRRRIIDEAMSQPIRERIVRRSANGGLFSKPICLLVYWLLRKHPRQTIDNWPLAQYRQDFETAMADLGIAR